MKFFLPFVLFASPLLATFEADIIEYNIGLLEYRINILKCIDDPLECIDVCQDMIHIIHYSQVLYDSQ